VSVDVYDPPSHGLVMGLFRPAAVAAQILVALAGMAAVTAALFSCQDSSCGFTRRRSRWSSA
jgi:hypothetical protein